VPEFDSLFPGIPGANLEWFTVQNDGSKVLINDPSPTSTTGIKAYYSVKFVSRPARAKNPVGAGTKGDCRREQNETQSSQVL
jgi:hypothetical protein